MFKMNVWSHDMHNVLFCEVWESRSDEKISARSDPSGYTCKVRSDPECVLSYILDFWSPIEDLKRARLWQEAFFISFGTRHLQPYVREVAITNNILPAKENISSCYSGSYEFHFYWTVVYRLVIWITFSRKNCTHPNTKSFPICKCEICK